MICCLCGEALREGEILLMLRRYRAVGEVRIPVPFENGRLEQVVHDLCPALFGAPLALTGADGSRADV
jgi:hypothetical protein